MTARKAQDLFILVVLFVAGLALLAVMAAQAEPCAPACQPALVTFVGGFVAALSTRDETTHDKNGFPLDTAWSDHKDSAARSPRDVVIFVDAGDGRPLGVLCPHRLARRCWTLRPGQRVSVAATLDSWSDQSRQHAGLALSLDLGGVDVRVLPR